MKVLVAEDDRLTREGLIEILVREGYEALGAEDGEAALRMVQTERPDFVCLDIMMPGLSGYEVCKRLRAQSPTLPIIFISAKSEEIDRVVGLELGADDFIQKPFGVREVVARIRAVTRRYLATREMPAPDAPFTLADLEVRPAELRGYRTKKGRMGKGPMGEGREGEGIDLSLRDLCILRLLFEHQGRVVDRNLLSDTCWGHQHLASSRSLDQHISQLRKRIERDPADPQIIRTVHGCGYRYE